MKKKMVRKKEEEKGQFDAMWPAKPKVFRV